MFGDGGHEFQFLDYNKEPIWTGNNVLITYNTSFDGGKTRKDEQFDQLFGTYFFLSEDIIIYNNILYTMSSLLSDFGGLFEPFVLPFFFYIGSIINDHYIMGKFIRALFYTENEYATNKEY